MQLPPDLLDGRSEKGRGNLPNLFAPYSLPPPPTTPSLLLQSSSVADRQKYMSRSFLFGVGVGTETAVTSLSLLLSVNQTFNFYLY